MSDTMDMMGGKAKEWSGRLTGNKRMEMKGKIQHDAASLRRRGKDELDNILTSIHDRY